MEKWALKNWIRLQNKVRNFMEDEAGETNIIAIILIIIVVIALVGIFRGQLEEIVNGLFGQIKDSLGL